MPGRYELRLQKAASPNTNPMTEGDVVARIRAIAKWGTQEEVTETFLVTIPASESRVTIGNIDIRP